VVIRSPAPEATGPGDAAWTLDAHAVDPEDGILLAGRWTSSRNGLLGTPALLEEVRLSEGAHTLTFAAQDAKGQAAQASFTVTVGPDPATDLRLEPADVALSVSGADPALETSGHLQRGRANLLTLTAQNQGLTNRIRLRSFVTPPTGSETLLGEQTVDAAPFARPWARFSYWPAAQGAHRFRGQLESLVQTDPHPANNTRDLSPAGIVGVPFEYRITADRAPTSFEASGLPGPLVSEGVFLPDGTFLPLPKLGKCLSGLEPRMDANEASRPPGCQGTVRISFPIVRADAKGVRSSFRLRSSSFGGQVGRRALQTLRAGRTGFRTREVLRLREREGIRPRFSERVHGKTQTGRGWLLGPSFDS
jgi:hypothetical protein